MTVASEITRIEDNISAAYTAADAKGATMPATENSDNLATCIASISGGGSGGTTDVPLTRFKDDTNTEIGTHFMNFQDGNGNTYKVILLDAMYRGSSGYVCSQNISITNLPIYDDTRTANLWEATETATQNTQLILDYCSAKSYTSTACSHCRNQSFTINGVTYYGQLPNMIEVFYLAKHYSSFDTLDTSSSTYSSLNFASSGYILSSSQSITDYIWLLWNICNMARDLKSASYQVRPVLEIPLS